MSIVGVSWILHGLLPLRGGGEMTVYECLSHIPQDEKNKPRSPCLWVLHCLLHIVIVQVHEILKDMQSFRNFVKHDLSVTYPYYG